MASCTTDMKPFYQVLDRLSKSSTLSLADVKLDPHVGLCDENDDLQMYCYFHSDQMESLPDSTKECRGVVFDKEGKLISKGFAFTPTYNTDTIPEDIKEYLIENFEHLQVFNSYEGCLVRIFFFNGVWYLSTHRKLNCFRSFWGSRVSFGDQFVNGMKAEDPSFDLQRFFESLDPKFQYSFLVRYTDENRMVSSFHNEVDRVIHVGTFQDGVMVYYEIPRISQQRELTFNSLENLCEYVNRSDWRKQQGVVIYMPNGKQVKIASTIYSKMFLLRGNQASVPFRYLELRSTDQQVDFISLYPEYHNKFLEYEKIITDLAQKLLNLYINKYIRRDTTVLPQEEYWVISSCHAWYKSQQSATKRAVDYDTVLKCLNETHPPALNKMIRGVLEKEKKAKQ